MKHFIFFYFHFFLLTNLVAQLDQTSNQFWLSGGLGQSESALFTNHGVLGGISCFYSDKQRVVSLGINHSWEARMEEAMQGEFTEWKIQYGWIQTNNKYQVYAIGGVAYSECIHYRELYKGMEGVSFQKDWTKETAFGMALETGVNYVINDHVGIGVSTFANLNKNAIIANYRFNILLGIFKNYSQ